MRQHESFILKPMSSLLEKAVSSVSGVGVAMDCYPLCEYLKDALLLQMTGFQEQKLKCIMWELATDDLDFRYKELLQKPLGQCSEIKDKQRVYELLIKQIQELSSGFKLNDLVKEYVVSDSKSMMNSLFEGTILKAGSEREYANYLMLVKSLDKKSFCVGNQLISGNVGSIAARDFYKEYLYRQRNRVAHNLLSYQENLPDLNSLANPNDCFRNYFLYYAFLMMLDGMFVETFRVYLSLCKCQYN